MYSCTHSDCCHIIFLVLFVYCIATNDISVLVLLVIILVVILITIIIQLISKSRLQCTFKHSYMYRLHIFMHNEYFQT